VQDAAGNNGNRGENIGSQSSQGQGRLDIPPQFRALMPQFMYRSGGGGFGGNANSNAHPFANSGLPMQQQQQQQQNFSMTQGNR
jgi:hypothetical protein